MEATFRYGGNDFPVVTGTAGSVQVRLDEIGGGPARGPALDIVTDRSGDNLTPDMAEELGRALLAWAADMRLAGA